MKVLLILSSIFFLSSIILHLIDRKNVCRKEQTQIELHLNEIYNAFENYSDNYFSIYGYNESISDNCIKIFNSYSLLIVNFNDNNEIEYSNRNSFVTKETLLGMLDSAESLVFRDNRAIIPLVKYYGKKKVALYINLSLENEKNDFDHTPHISNNKTIISSDNFTISRSSRFDNIVSSPTGKPLFSFTESVKKIDFLLVNILFSIGFALLLIFQILYLSKQYNSIKETIKHLVISSLFIYFPLTIIYIADYSCIAVWLLSIYLLFTSYISHRIFINCIKRTISKEIIKTWDLMLFTGWIITIILLLSFEIYIKFNNYTQYRILDLIPTAIIGCSLINYISTFDIFKNNIEKKRNKIKYLFTILFFISTAVIYINFKIGLIFILLLISIIIDSILVQKFTFFKSHYLLLISIAAICIFTESNIDRIEYLNRYETQFNDNLHNFRKDRVVNYNKIEPLSEFYNKINELVSELLFSLTTILGLGFIIIKLRNIPRKIKRNGTLPYRFYIIIALIFIVVAISSKLLIIHSNDNQFNRHIAKTYNFIKSDFKHKYHRNPNWYKSLEERYNIKVDLYNLNGEIINTKYDETDNSEDSPNQLSNKVLNSVRNITGDGYLAKENNLFSKEYTTLYLITPDNVILRIPFDRDATNTSNQTIFFRIIIIFFAIFIALLLFTIIYYYNNSLPIKALSGSENLVKSRQQLAISPIVEDCSQVKNMVEEYNKMICELEDQYKLQISIDQQENLNKISRMLAHEIKNPLTPILLSAQLALRLKRNNNPRWHETIEDTLETIISQTERISQIISQIMSRSTIYQDDSSKIDVMLLLSEVEKFYSPYRNINFTIENHCSSTKTIFMDNNLLWSVITNITINAIDAIIEQSNKGGVIIFRVSEELEKLIISIQNNGKPIPQSIRKDIFKYKYTTKKDGNGLGLFFAHHIIAKEGGRLYLNEKNCEFTEFIVEIPFSKQ